MHCVSIHVIQWGMFICTFILYPYMSFSETCSFTHSFCIHTCHLVRLVHLHIHCVSIHVIQWDMFIYTFILYPYMSFSETCSFTHSLCIHTCHSVRHVHLHIYCVSIHVIQWDMFIYTFIVYPYISFSETCSFTHSLCIHTYHSVRHVHLHIHCVSIHIIQWDIFIYTFIVYPYISFSETCSFIITHLHFIYSCMVLFAVAECVAMDLIFVLDETAAPFLTQIREFLIETLSFISNLGLREVQFAVLSSGLQTQRNLGFIDVDYNDPASSINQWVTFSQAQRNVLGNSIEGINELFVQQRLDSGDRSIETDVVVFLTYNEPDISQLAQRIVDFRLSAARYIAVGVETSETTLNEIATVSAWRYMVPSFNELPSYGARTSRAICAAALPGTVKLLQLLSVCYIAKPHPLFSK